MNVFTLDYSHPFIWKLSLLNPATTQQHPPTPILYPIFFLATPLYFPKFSNTNFFWLLPTTTQIIFTRIHHQPYFVSRTNKITHVLFISTSIIQILLRTTIWFTTIQHYLPPLIPYSRLLIASRPHYSTFHRNPYLFCHYLPRCSSTYLLHHHPPIPTVTNIGLTTTHHYPYFLHVIGKTEPLKICLRFFDLESFLKGS